MNTLHLLDLPNHEARRLLATGVPVWLHVNPVEYHGPHLSLHNDGLISRGLAERLHARLWPELPHVAMPDLEVGADPVQGPGTRTVPYPTVRALVLEAVQALHALGAQRVVLMTFHGAPLHNLAIHAGLEWLWARGVQAVAPFHGLLQQLVDPQPEMLDAAVAAVPAERRQEARALLATDYHAGMFETSLALALAPDSVSPSHLELPDCPPCEPDALMLRAADLARRMGRGHLATELHFGAWGTGWLNLRPFPGYTGRPAWASAEIGEAFAQLLVGQYAALTQGVFEDRIAHPPPVFAWLAKVSAGGRLLPKLAPL